MPKAQRSCLSLTPEHVEGRYRARRAFCSAGGRCAPRRLRRHDADAATCRLGHRDGRRIVYDLYDDHVGELLEQAISHVEHVRAGLARTLDERELAEA